MYDCEVREPGSDKYCKVIQFIYEVTPSFMYIINKWVYT